MFKHISTVSSATIRNMLESNVHARITASCKENSFYRYFVYFHERVYTRQRSQLQRTNGYEVQEPKKIHHLKWTDFVRLKEWVKMFSIHK